MMVKATLLKLLALFLLVTASTCQVFSKKCNKSSQCKLLTNCPSMLQLVKARTNLKSVREAICGFKGRTPKVCCPFNEFFPSSCGHTSTTDRIFNGEEAPLGGYPWMASLGYLDQNNPKLEFLCAGSIINQRYILTAAHCFDPRDIGDRHLSVIRLGEWNLETNPDCEAPTLAGQVCAPPRLDVFPDDVIIHRDYDNRARHSDDIALIRVDRNIQFSPFIQPICLPPSNIDVFTAVGDRDLLAMGWGYTEDRSEIVEVMRRVRLPLQPHEQCRKSHGSRYLDKQLCVGGVDEKDTCSGDSGGPLVIVGPNGPPYLQLGIVSYGPVPCGIPHFPAVYTSVASYKTWIAENMEPW